MTKNASCFDATVLSNVSYVGNILGPLFLHEPQSEQLRPFLREMAAADAQAIAQEWPFVNPPEVEALLLALREGAKDVMLDVQRVAVASAECEAKEPDARECGTQGSGDVAPAEDSAVVPFRETVQMSTHTRAVDSLMGEYRRLFRGPAAMPAPPWGSVYTDRECVVFGASTLQLRSWMRQNGLVRQSQENDPDDHIGLMLLFMAWLSEQRPELLEDYLSQHVLTWSSHYLEELEQAAEHPFYCSLAKLARLSLEGMQRELGLKVEYPRYYR